MEVKIKEIHYATTPQIAVVGVGSGCEVIEQLKKSVTGIKLIALDSVAPTYIKDTLRDSHFAIIIADLSNATDAQSVLVVAQSAKDLGAFTIIITNRTNADIDTLLTLQSKVDSILIAKNSTKNIACAVQSIAGAILNNNNNGLNLDLADFEVTIKGFGFIGFSEKNGADSAVNAMIEIMQSFGDIKGAKSAIIHYVINEKYPMQELANANAILYQLNADAFCKQGWSWDNSLEPMQVKVTLIVANIEKCIGTFKSLYESFKFSESSKPKKNNKDDKERAKETILKSGDTSISYLQHALDVGFDKALNIIESLEKDGFLSVSNSKDAREISVDGKIKFWIHNLF